MCSKVLTPGAPGVPQVPVEQFPSAFHINGWKCSDLRKRYRTGGNLRSEKLRKF